MMNRRPNETIFDKSPLQISSQKLKRTKPTGQCQPKSERVWPLEGCCNVYQVSHRMGSVNASVKRAHTNSPTTWHGCTHTHRRASPVISLRGKQRCDSVHVVSLVVGRFVCTIWSRLKRVTYSYSSEEGRSHLTYTFFLHPRMFPHIKLVWNCVANLLCWKYHELKNGDRWCHDKFLFLLK